MEISEQSFGGSCHLITITNQNGISLSVSDLGTQIVHLQTMIDNEKRELVLDFGEAKEYLEKDPHIGALIGHMTGRVMDGTFELDDEAPEIGIDPGTGHCLHGGAPSSEAKQWHYTVVNGENESSVIFYQTSPDMENGFLDTLDVEVRYILTNDDTWRVTVQGISDRKAVFNPTNHVYFNLTGDPAQPIDKHTLWLNSRLFVTLNRDMTPTEEVVSAGGTAFDFQHPKELGEVFASDSRQSMMVDGIDRPFLLKKQPDLLKIAELTSPGEKVSIQVKADALGIVIFTVNLGEDGPKMRGKKLVSHGGITFETQGLPGAERLESFGDATLEPNQVREFVTEYKINKYKEME